METVEQSTEEFLRIMLGGTLELGGVETYAFLWASVSTNQLDSVNMWTYPEHIRRESIAFPHLDQKCSIRFSDFAFGTKRIPYVDGLFPTAI